jgi:hypothetical protein
VEFFFGPKCSAGRKRLRTPVLAKGTYVASNFMLNASLKCTLKPNSLLNDPNLTNERSSPFRVIYNGVPFNDKVNVKKRKKGQMENNVTKKRKLN